MNKLRLSLLEITNFLSHKHTKFEFRPQHRLLIDGASGNGKSALLEAISWVLFGEGRVDNRSMVRKGEKEAKVKLVLEEEETGRIYWIIRSITSGGKHDLYVAKTERFMSNIEPIPVLGIKGAQEWIENDLLHCSRALFENSVCYPQDHGDTFVKLSAAKRKDLLLEMARSIDFDAYLKKARELATKTSQDVAVQENTVDYLRTRIEEDTAKANQLEAVRQQEKEAQEQVKKLDAQLALRSEEKARYEIAQNNAKAAQNALYRVKNDLEEVKNTQTTNQAKKQQALENLDKLDEKLSSSDYLVTQEDLDEFESKKLWLQRRTENEILVSSQRERIRLLEEDIKRIQSEPIESCPAIKGPCAKIKQRNEEEIKKIQEQIITEKEILSKHEESPSLVVDYDEAAHIRAKANFKEAIMLKARKENESAAIKFYSEAEFGTTEKIKKLTDEYNIAMEDCSVKLQELNAVKDSASSLMALEQERNQAFTYYSAIVGSVRIAQEAAEALPRHSEALSKALEQKIQLETKLADLEAMKAALGTNGLKAMVVDLVVPRLEERANDILAKLSDFTLRIDTQKTGTTGGVVEGLFLGVIDPQGNQMDFDSYSGGEKLKIVVALSEALAEMQKLDFRILDELFIGLDSESVERFSQTLLAIQDRYSQLLCISHLQPIKDLFTDRLLVTKVNGVSSVVG